MKLYNKHRCITNGHNMGKAGIGCGEGEVGVLKGEKRSKKHNFI